MAYKHAHPVQGKFTLRSKTTRVVAPVREQKHKHEHKSFLDSFNDLGKSYAAALQRYMHWADMNTGADGNDPAEPPLLEDRLDPILDPLEAETQQETSWDRICKRFAPLQSPYPFKASTRLSYELRYAKRLHKRFETRIYRALMTLSGHDSLRLEQLRTNTNELIESIIRNPDAYAYWIRHCSDHQYAMNYSLRVATWTALFGRHLQLSREHLSDVVLGALLCKIGYMALPDDMFNHQGTPSPQEREMMKVSLNNTLKLLENSPGFSQRVVTIVRHHLERYDGSGYPAGLTQDDIPLLSQMIGLADFYEEITSHDFASEPLAASDAVRELRHQTDVLFDADLIAEFTQAIGRFPTGSLVRIRDTRKQSNNTALARVIAQSTINKDRPRLQLLTPKPWWKFYDNNQLALDLDNSHIQIVASFPAKFQP